MIAETPFFSICIPAHDALPLIETALGSIAAQCFKDWEVIVVDDCSEDGTAAWLERQVVISPNKLFVVHLDKNKGPFYARKVAFQRSRGRYILCIDADDELIGVEALGSLHKAIIGAETQPDVVLFNATLDRARNTRWVNYASENMTPGIVDKELVTDVFLKTHILNNLCLKAIRRDLLLPVNLKGAEGLLMCEDRLEVAGVLARASHYLLLDERLYYYRQNLASTTHRMFDLDYFRQQSRVESTIAELFSNSPAIPGQRKQFLMMCADDMLRIARGRTVQSAAECYELIRSDEFFSRAYASEGTMAQRGDRAILLRLLWSGYFTQAALIAKCINLIKNSINKLSN